MDQKTAFGFQKAVIKDSMLGVLDDLFKARQSDEPDESLINNIMLSLSLSCENQDVSGASGSDDLNWFDISELGRPAGLDHNNLDAYLNLLNSELASSFAKFEKIGVRYSSYSDKPAFSIGINGNINNIEPVMRASCAHAVITPASQDNLNLNHKSSAVCNIIFMDANDSEHKTPHGKDRSRSPEVWLDRIAAALPGSKCQVEIIFNKINKEYIRERLYAINKLNNELENLKETSWQVSGNIGSSTAEFKDMLRENLKKITGTERDTPNCGMSASYSRTLHNNEAEYLSKKLKFCAARLSQMLSSGAHTVNIFAAAESQDELKALQAVMSGALALNYINLEWQNNFNNNKSLMLPDHSLDLFFSVPAHEFPGFAIRELENYNINIKNNSEKPALYLGRVLWNDRWQNNNINNNNKIFIPFGEINRHVCVFGMTGSGKTNSVCNLLTELDRPFLVIEPVKGDYRSLYTAAKRKTEIFTLDVSGDNICAVNPLWFPIGSSLQYHIDSIKTIISSAFDLYAAMPNILEQCLINTYIKSGWNIVTSRNIFEGRLPDDRLYPVISDLCVEIENYMNASGFSGETKDNYKGALLSRLQSFTTGSKGIILNQNSHLNFEKIIKDGTNLVIELDAIADDADKAIVMGTILTQYCQCVKFLSEGNAHGELKHIIVIEEAHHLFAGAETEAGKDGSGARRKLSESLSNLLAEIRSYGEGIIIVDQSPSRISPEVIKNTAVKIIHRVDYGKDIEMLRDALLLRQGDTTAAKLRKGEALVRFGGMDKPALVYIDLSQAKENFDEPVNRKIRSENLIQSAADIIINNKSFKLELTEACGLFINQALFDGLEKIRAAMSMLLCQTEKLIYIHGYDELVQASGREELVTKIIIQGIRAMLRKFYPEQKYLREIAEIYIERIIKLETGGRKISEKEWLLISDFRDKQLHARVREFYDNNNNADFILLRMACGHSRYLGLVYETIKDLEKFINNINQAGQSSINYSYYKNNADKLLEAVKKSMLRNFYLMPDDNVLEIIFLLVKKYLDYITGERIRWFHS